MSDNMNDKQFKEAMKRAQGYLKEGEYERARTLLEGLDARYEHPTIKKWLAQLDKLAPKDDPFGGIDDVKPAKKGKKSRGCLRWAAIIIMGVCGLSIVSAILFPPSQEDLATRTAIVESTRAQRTEIAIAEQSDVAINTPTLEVVATLATFTDTPEPTETPMDLLSALKEIETDSITVTEAESFELSQTTQIVFTMPANREIGLAFVREVLCVARPYLPEGYRIKVHGQNAASIGVITIFVDNDVLMSLSCPFTGDLESIAFEYSVASGLR